MAEPNTSNIGFEKQIWDAACVLRGNIDASEYKSVVLGLIFLKYISDRFEAKYNELVAEGDIQHIQPLIGVLLKKLFDLPIGPGAGGYLRPLPQSPEEVGNLDIDAQIIQVLHAIHGKGHGKHGKVVFLDISQIQFTVGIRYDDIISHFLTLLSNPTHKKRMISF